jgi:hypothetical protein
MLANPVPFGILALEIFFGYGTLGSGFATGTKIKFQTMTIWNCYGAFCFVCFNGWDFGWVTAR